MIGRRRALMLAGAAGLAAWRFSAAAEAQDDGGIVIPVVARRFNFTPAEIEIRRGVVVVLAFTAVDFMHGFNVPDLGVRADLVPGRVTKVRILAPLAGTYDFLCDNFCGDGHEGMSGKLIVRG
ncbi:MAG TPA: cupredoxin domain-containing protein [Burkholderiaceae bacterium]|nr:cupredoxin domain-containing protein [Burkholderiaceae bacterium]